LSNPIYTSRQVDFIKEFVGSDSELTATFNDAFGTIISKSALRKKRQRMGISKTAEQFRIAWMSLVGHSPEEIGASLLSDPPVDIYAEQLELSAVRRGEWARFPKT
jgi:hypothetical protein